MLGSITEGRVSRVLVREGDAVREGQILVAIHSHEIMDARSGLVRAQSMHRTAQAERDAAEVAYARAERLLSAKAMGQAEVDQARVHRTAAVARLAETAAELERATGLVEHLLGEGPLPDGLDPHEVLIRAPFSGVVVQRTAVAGSVVLPGEPLLSVADPRALQLEVRLSDRQVGQVAVGSRVRFTLVGEVADAPSGRRSCVASHRWSMARRGPRWQSPSWSMCPRARAPSDLPTRPSRVWRKGRWWWCPCMRCRRWPAIQS
jgi:membrane fusion protein, heavy metal efflux system